MAGSYLLYNHLHYNGLMTNLGFVLLTREDHNIPSAPRSGKMLKMSVKKQTYEQPNPIFSSIFVANLHHSRRVFFALVKKTEPRRLSSGEATMIRRRYERIYTNRSKS